MLPATLLALLLACPGKDDDDDDDRDDTGDGGGGGFFDGGGDGGAGDGGGDGGAGDGGAGDGGAGDGGAGDGGAGDGGGGGGPCPDYLGFGEVGTVRTYGTTARYEAELGGSGTYTLETVSLGSTVELAYADEFHYDTGATSRSSGTYRYTCNGEGAFLTSTSTAGSYESPSYDYTWTSTTTYPDPQLAVPWDLAAGDTWTDAWTWSASGTSSSGGGWSNSGAGSTTTEVQSGGAVSTPAGSFTTLRFEATTTIDGSRSSSTWYGDAEAGMVESDFYELLALD